MESQTRPVLYAGRHYFTTAHAPVFANRAALDGDFERHSHDFVEVMMIGHGHGVHHTIHGERPLGAGDVYVLRPGAWHAYRACRGLDVYTCCFGIELLQRELAWTRDEPGLNYLLHSGPLALDRRGVLALRAPRAALAACRPHLDALQRLGLIERGDDKAAMLGYLLLVLAELARHVDMGRTTEARRRRPMHEAVARGLRLLEDDLAYPWSLAGLAGHLHVDGSYLVRLFNAHTGLSPMAYLAHQRAERAASLLLRTERPVAEIAREVGWSDPNYFARRFKAYFGLSASAYRARYADAALQADRTHQLVERISGVAGLKAPSA